MTGTRSPGTRVRRGGSRARSGRPRRLLRAPAAPIALVLAAAGLTACSPGEADEQPTLTVLAAASLTGTSTALAEQFEAEHDARVDLAFESSATLAQQAAGGAPADVLATADARTMGEAVDAGATAAEPTTFARNRLVLVTPRANPAGITGLDDLAGTAWVRCVPSAPCGAVADVVLRRHGVTAAAVSQEVDVKATLTKVTEGEADAALVYATDAVAAGDRVRRHEIPGAAAAATAYRAAPLAQAEHPGLAEDWVALLTSAAGQAVLTDAGFAAP